MFFYIIFFLSHSGSATACLGQVYILIRMVGNSILCVHVCVCTVGAERSYCQWYMAFDQYSVERVQGSSYREIHNFDLDLWSSTQQQSCIDCVGNQLCVGIFLMSHTVHCSESTMILPFVSSIFHIPFILPASNILCFFNPSLKNDNLVNLICIISYVL